MDKEDKEHSSNDLSEDEVVDDSTDEEPQHFSNALFDDIDDYKVENFVEDGKHYSHDHPLKLMSRCEDDKEDDDDEAYKSLCMICGVPILSSPSYTCSIGCKFIIHQPCALKLPTTLIHPTHGPRPDGKHTLRIEPSSTIFIYKCEDCTFSLHPLVAFPHLEIKIKHKSHTSHLLVAFCKRISCECDACGREQNGFFFYCGECNFWIHQDCTILPSALQFSHRRYPFILAYSLPYYLVAGSCVICRKDLLVRHNGVYFSPESFVFAHIACGSTHKFASKAKLESIQLPDDEWDTTFPILVIRRYGESKPFDLLAHKKYSSTVDAIGDGDGDIEDEDGDDDGDGDIEDEDGDDDGDDDIVGEERDDDGDDDIEDEESDADYDDSDGDGDVEFTINRYHNCDDYDNNTNRESSRNLYCDLCTRAINSSSSLHKCNSCHFVAHTLCADILPVLKFFIPVLEKEVCHGKRCLDLSEKLFNSIFYCIICHRPCNGFCHYFDDFGDTDFFIDLECMAAPSTINHASHPQHLLIRTHQLSGVAPLTCCPDKTFIYDVYRCILCDYFMHVSCAMLPKRIVCHDCDEHPLHLAFTSTSNLSCANFCEVCEEEIDLNYWLYRCQECDKFFHINCIPSVGYLSKVKFGGTLSLPHSHSHPLALTRMLTAPSQRCGHCNQIIQGMQDQMAFFCSHCHFWLHFSCARDANATPLKLYTELDHELGRPYLHIYK